MKLHKLAASAAAALLAVTAFSGCGAKGKYVQISENYEDCPVAVIEIENFGTVKAVLFEKQCPKTVENFITLAEQDYYDGLTFHRVMDEFMIQGGDPKGDGTGGESCWGGKFEDEFDASLRNFRGALSMANSGKDTNGSQFFIVQQSDGSVYTDDYIKQFADPVGYVKDLADEYLKQGAPKADVEAWLEYQIEAQQSNLDYYKQQGYPSQTFPKEVVKFYRENGGTPWLDMRHTVFGHVIEGMDVVDAVAAVSTNASNMPNEAIVIRDITIER